MEEKIFKTYVKGIYCVSCPELIIAALMHTRGVIDADVEYFKSLVTVRFDPEIVSQESLCTVLSDAGYPTIERKPTLGERLLSMAAHLFDR